MGVLIIRTYRLPQRMARYLELVRISKLLSINYGKVQ